MCLKLIESTHNKLHSLLPNKAEDIRDRIKAGGERLYNAEQNDIRTVQ